MFLCNACAFTVLKFLIHFITGCYLSSCQLCLWISSLVSFLGTNNAYWGGTFSFICRKGNTLSFTCLFFSLWCYLRSVRSICWHMLLLLSSMMMSCEHWKESMFSVDYVCKDGTIQERWGGNRQAATELNWSVCQDCTEGLCI